jgi:ethanolamine utilization cobalamin adenosyltransferase
MAYGARCPAGPASPTYTNTAIGDTAMSKQKTKNGGAAKKTSTKAEGAAKPAKPKADKPKRVSCLDAAALVLKDAKAPMQARALVDAMKAKGLWSSDAPTPWATLYSAIIREIGKKGKDARFKKTDRGHFTLNANA